MHNLSLYLLLHLLFLQFGAGVKQKMIYYNWDLISRNNFLTCYAELIAVVWEHSDITISPKGQET